LGVGGEGESQGKAADRDDLVIARSRAARNPLFGVCGQANSSLRSE